MNCTEAEVYVSAVSDGEPIPSEAAHHIATCESCRRTLNDYSRMGIELRLAATIEEAQLPPLKLPMRRSRFGFLQRRVAVPQFALAGLIACIVLAVAATSLVRAQSRPLWFQFAYGFQEKGKPFHYAVAKEGYDNTSSTLGFQHGAPVATAFRVKVESISENDVILRCRAVPARVEATGNGFKLLGEPQGGVSLDGVARVHYKPGEQLTIPIEGGGTLYVKGDVMDHQPKIAFGVPLEPAAGKLVVRSPVLTASGELVGEFNGASAASHEGEAVNFGTRSEGIFRFALQPFPGAVQGEANWGEIMFRLNGKDYRLVAAAPITGGEQPRTVWVRHDAQVEGGVGCSGGCLGAGAVAQ